MKYDLYPEIKINGNHTIYEYKDIINVLSQIDKKWIVVDIYPGVANDIYELMIESIKPDRIILSEDIYYDTDKINTIFNPYLTEDKVRGKMYPGTLLDIVDKDKLVSIQDRLNKDEKTLIYGVGASIITKGDLYLYVDIPRWEIQLRYRQGMPNFKCNNEEDEFLLKYKRGYFIEWRIADKHKIANIDSIDYYIDGKNIKMITRNTLLDSMNQVVNKPFRLVPYFDPGVWGGQWMKEHFHLNKNKPNYAWSFDGVPEENSILLSINHKNIEMPAINLVLYKPVELLGKYNVDRFGAEFPIRFDMLDTMNGQNLSLQVHPLKAYIQSQYGMKYTQDESYYILDSNNGGVYLGLKENVNFEEMIKDLNNNQSFPANKYINYIPAKKHDHFLIPAGTIHCASKNCMVLEISATPYIFTYKLYDWDRVGLDGKPRPIHIDDGIKNIDWNRDTNFVYNELVNQITVLNNEDYLEEKTGLHPLEFIETRRFTSNKSITHDTNHHFHMLNLVEGEALIIESPNHQFDPYIIHYAETFIIPASIDSYIIKPYNNQEIKYIQAYIRNKDNHD